MPLKPLKVPEDATPSELIKEVERKDRRFRLFQAIFMVGTFVALIFIISSLNATLSTVRDQVAQQKETNAEDAERSEDSDNKIIRRLNCMVVFFSTQNRSNLSIDDIDRCTLNRDEDVQQFFAEPEQTPAEQPPNLDDSAQSAPQENGRAQSTTPNNAGSGDDEQNDDDDTSGEQRDPVTVKLPIFPAIPLCVPVTGICVR